MDTTKYTTRGASVWLHTEMPQRTAEQWRQVLITNRRPGRKPIHLVPFERTSKRDAWYEEAALVALVNFEKSRILGTMALTPRAAEVFAAFGIGQPGGSSTGRAFDVNLISRQVDESTGAIFVQIVLRSPTLVFRLSPDQAGDVARELLEAADYEN